MASLSIPPFSVTGGGCCCTPRHPCGACGPGGTIPDQICMTVTRTTGVGTLGACWGIPASRVLTWSPTNLRWEVSFACSPGKTITWVFGCIPGTNLINAIISCDPAYSSTGSPTVGTITSGAFAPLGFGCDPLDYTFNMTVERLAQTRDTATIFDPDGPCAIYGYWVFNGATAEWESVDGFTVRIRPAPCPEEGGGGAFMARVSLAATRREAIRRVKLPCVHLGDRLSGRSCGNPVYSCSHFGDRTRPPGKCGESDRGCVGCPAYQPRGAIEPAKTSSSHRDP